MCCYSGDCYDCFVVVLCGLFEVVALIVLGSSLVLVVWLLFATSCGWLCSWLVVALFGLSVWPLAEVLGLYVWVVWGCGLVGYCLPLGCVLVYVGCWL